MNRPDSTNQKLYLTAGEPAGIGPELVLKAARHLEGVAVIADEDLLEETTLRLGLPANTLTDNGAEIIHCPLRAAVIPGQLDPENSSYVLKTLRHAASMCLDTPGSRLVTAPVHKGVINDAGVAFSGHTEFLAGISGVDRVVMMLASGSFRVALVTTHLPLSAVAAAVTKESVSETIIIVARELKNRFSIAQPRINVCGLNPHAGEGGHLGHEEIRVISPAIEACRAEGINVNGPFPADTAFTKVQLEHCDASIAMYHDQGLPVLKYAGFGKAVNITLGLPFVRTSVDHGTALDIAGSGKADVGSLLEAISTAREMIAL